MSRNRSLRSIKAVPPPGFRTPPASAGNTAVNSRGRKNKKPVRLEQWVEVTIQNGQTVTTLYPSNADLIKYSKKLDPPPQDVCRRINFVNGIPAEYDWVGVQSEEHRQRGGCGLQRMTFKGWLRAIEEEAAYGDGHLGPVFNLPHSKGECECEVCQSSAKLLAELEAKAKAAGRAYDTDSLLQQYRDEQERK